MSRRATFEEQTEATFSQSFVQTPAGPLSPALPLPSAQWPAQRTQSVSGRVAESDVFSNRFAESSPPKNVEDNRTLGMDAEELERRGGPIGEHDDSDEDEEDDDLHGVECELDKSISNF